MLILDAYSLRDLQVLTGLLQQAETAGVPEVGALRDLLQRRVAERMAAQRLSSRRTLPRDDRAASAALLRRARIARARMAANRCPACGAPAVTAPVNDSAATMVGGDYTVAIVCRNTGCRHTEYR